MNNNDKTKEANLASFWKRKFEEAMIHKAPYVRKWNTYFEAYNGDYFKNASLPDYKSDFVANYVFSTVETIRPIMVDNDPKFQVLPRQPEGMESACPTRSETMPLYRRCLRGRIPMPGHFAS